MSFESIELWRPRREPGRRLRGVIVTLLVLAGSGTAAVMMRRPLVLVLGFSAALALACVWSWLRGGAPEWVALLPRRWVPRVPSDRRLEPGADRRGPTRAPAIPRDPCNPQRARRTVAIGGPPLV